MGKFTFTQTEIPGVVVIEPQVFGDDRGYFMETYQKDQFAEAGIDKEFVQDNQSQAMPKYSELHKQFAPVLMQELKLKQWPRYDYSIKILTRILMDDTQMTGSETVQELCRLAVRAQEYMKETGKTTLQGMDLANIM